MQLQINSKAVHAALAELSDREQSKYFLASDIAVKMLANKFGMSKVGNADKAKATNRVSTVVRSMSMGQKTDIVVSEAKMSPSSNHYPGVKSGLGYRIGMPKGEVNGNLAPKSENQGFIATRSEHPPQPKPPKNTAMGDALQAAQNVDDDTEAATEEVFESTKSGSFAEYVSTLSFDELSELSLECQMRQAALYEEAQDKVTKVQEHLKVLNNLGKEIA